VVAGDGAFVVDDAWDVVVGLGRTAAALHDAIFAQHIDKNQIARSAAALTWEGWLMV
jgi:hypothetical protein